MKTNTPTTPASVASRLTDEEIAEFADTAYIGATNSMQDSVIAAVLRDYVRLRKLANAVKTVAIGKDSDYHKVTEIERLLAEAEKGEAK